MLISYLLLILSFFSLNETKFQKCPGTNSMGTVLFTASDVSKQCWSPDEIAVLTARMLFEDVIPDINVLYIDSDSFVNDLVDYFKMLICSVRGKTHGRKKHILLLALTDLIGGYLQHSVLPIARQAFYSGLIDYTNMEKLIELFEEMKWFLRTNGQGWAKPLVDTPAFEVDVIDLKYETLKTNNNQSCCSKLIYYEHELSKKICHKNGLPQVSVHFPLPFFDSGFMPSAIAVPFRKFSVRNIESRKASYILLKFFLIASQCLLDREANQESIKKFHDLYYTWIEQDVLPKLKDDKFYSAFGGILRVYETLKTLGAERTSLINTPSVTQNCADEGIIAPEAKPVAKRSTAVIIAMITIISLWFIIGTAFICYRMRKNRSNLDKKTCPNSTSSSGSSMLSGISSKSDSRKSSTCKCHSSEKSTDITTGSISSEYDLKDSNKSRKLPPPKPLTVCYPPGKPPFMVKDDDSPAVIDAKQAMKLLPSIPEMSEHSSHTKEDLSGKHKHDVTSHSFLGEPLATSSKEDIKEVSHKKKLSFSMDPDMKLVVRPCPKYSDKSKHRSFSERVSGKSLREKQYDDCYCKTNATPGSSADSSKKNHHLEDTTDDTEVSAKSPRAFACHSSLTGDHNNEHPVSGDKPYVFGYDFQTSSSSDLSEEDDMKISSSKTS